MYNHTLLINSLGLFLAAWCTVSLLGKTGTVYGGRGVKWRQFLFLEITLSLSAKSHSYSSCKDVAYETFCLYSISNSRVCVRFF